VNTAASAFARGQKSGRLPPTFSHMWTPDLNFNNEPESKKIDPELPLGSRGGKAAKASIWPDLEQCTRSEFPKKQILFI